VIHLRLENQSVRLEGHIIWTRAPMRPRAGQPGAPGSIGISLHPGKRLPEAYEALLATSAGPKK
jgi:hypothetical protein